MYSELINHELHKGSEIGCSGKSKHFLPHMWHPSRCTLDTLPYMHHNVNVAVDLISNMKIFYK